MQSETFVPSTQSYILIVNMSCMQNKTHIYTRIRGCYVFMFDTYGWTNYEISRNTS